ncbi:hypothetical protein HG531_004623 [Fusarium graminearum]|nr:hypothetical protein HG531_004623 [Fusarium graminearum]
MYRLRGLDNSLFLAVIVVDLRDIGIIAIKDSCDLFEGRTLSLNVEEEDKDELDSDPDLFVFVGKVLESDGVGLVTDGESNLDEEVHDHQTSGTESEGANLQSVGDDQTRPGNGVTDVEEPDKGDLGISEALDLCLTASSFPIIKDGEFVLTNSGSKEERATTEAINSQRTTNGNEKLEHVLSGVQSSLLSLILDSSALVNNVGVVADQSITRVLRNDTQGDQEHETVTVALGSEKVDVATGLLGLVLEGNGVLDLVVFELHGRVVDIAVGVVFREDGESFLMALVGHEPSRRFGDPPDKGDLDKGGDSLDQGDASP